MGPWQGQPAPFRSRAARPPSEGIVFGAFVISPDRMLQQFGLGLAVAVLVDALVIRCLVVPAVMRLFGARAWWLPRWLDRTLPSVALEPRESHSETVEFTRSNEMR